MKHLRYLLLVVVLSLFMAGCGTEAPPPKKQYVVQGIVKNAWVRNYTTYLLFEHDSTHEIVQINLSEPVAIWSGLHCRLYLEESYYSSEFKFKKVEEIR